MGLLSLEHSKAAYRADFLAYSLSTAVLAGVLFGSHAHAAQRPAAAGMALAGLAVWTLVEYLIHRFLMHGMEPFRRWHAEHHDRPTALIGTPTVFSAALIGALVFLPSLCFTSAWMGGALTLGVLTGYLAYGSLHHGLHHWRMNTLWMKRRKLWHARHHHLHATDPGHYGVTTVFWDHVFGTAKAGRRKAPARDTGVR